VGKSGVRLGDVRGGPASLPALKHIAKKVYFAGAVVGRLAGRGGEGGARCPGPDIRARFGRIVELIQTHGLEQVREPYVKHLEGRVWEMRMKGRDGIARAAYVTASGAAWSWCMCS
jgi:hypothetical protein